jgi:hypothetical protein
MKTIMYFLCIIGFLFFGSHTVFAEISDHMTLDTRVSSETVTASAVAGAINVDGKNYQQIGIRAEFPIGKFGLGIDCQLLFDDQGNVRKEDWDEFEDYLNLIYYVRWAHKGDPFYTKVGGLDFSSLGYGIILNGYTNMIEYPTYKRIGMEMSFESEKLGGELFLNDYKELIADKPGLLVGARLTYKVFGDLTIGVTVVKDFNEYNGLRDTDGDDVPDEIDYDMDNEEIATELDYWTIGKNAQSDTIELMIRDGLIDPTTKKELQTYFNEKLSTSTVFGADISYPLLKRDGMTLDIYGQAAKIKDFGWGFSAPGLRLLLGPIKFLAEYRYSQDEFLFGYYNSTYELERATFIKKEDSSWDIITKEMTLKTVEKMDGYLVGAGANLGNIVEINASYQDLSGSNDTNRSIYGEIKLNKNVVPKISTAKLYYYQNNVENFSEWKTPGTVMGYIIGFGLTSGASVNFNFRYTFEDKNGDGIIDGEEETLKSIGIGTTVVF